MKQPKGICPTPPKRGAPKKDPAMVKALTQSVRMTEEVKEKIVRDYGGVQAFFDMALESIS